MKIERFEDIQAWQEARQLTRMIYNAINAKKQFKQDFQLRGQIAGATISTMSNIAEGFSRRSNKEFIQYLFISKASAAEVQSLLYVALDQNYIEKEIFQKVYNQADKVAQLDSGFIKYLMKAAKHK